jgi:hypothetical protein
MGGGALGPRRRAGGGTGSSQGNLKPVHEEPQGVGVVVAVVGGGRAPRDGDGLRLRG